MTVGRHQFDSSIAARAARMGDVLSMGFVTLVWLVSASWLMTSAVAAQEAESDVDDQIWICAYDLQSEKSRRLFTVPHLHSAGSVTLSPDGQRIAFDGALPGQQSTPDSHIWICNFDGTQMTDMGPGAMPTWSPRGRRLAFSRYSPERGVWIMHADGSNSRLIDEAGWCAQWSPNGRMIAYTRSIDGAADFAIFNLVEDEFSVLFGDGKSGYRSFNWNFVWSPDSTRLCFKGSAASENHIASVTVDSNPVITVHHRQRATFSPDFAWIDNSTIGVSLWSKQQATRQLFALSTDPPTDGTPNALHRIEGQFTDRTNAECDVSRDGKTMLYVSFPRSN